MNWPTALVLIVLTLSTVGISGIAVWASVKDRNRLLRAAVSRQDYVRLEAREMGDPIYNSGVPPSMVE